MKLLHLALIVTMGCATAATLATSQTLHPVGQRPTGKIAADLDVPEVVFIRCFSGVSPDHNHSPSGAQQRANKAILLGCLQQENPAITNNILDEVMDRYRPEGPMRG